jgi:hypothetical protein
MSDTHFQQQVITELQKLNGRFDTLEWRFDTLEWRFDTLGGKVDSLTSELHEFKESQQRYNERMEDKTDALWTLSNQAFSAIADLSHKTDDMHQEVVSPWKRRQSKIA